MPILDLEGGFSGPLAGLAAAAEWLASDPPEALFSLAVDTPLFPRDFVRRALPLLESAPAVVAGYGPEAYATNALWRFSAVAHLPGAVQAETAPRGPTRLAEELGAVRLDYAGLAPDNPFRNANTPDDLALLRRLADRIDEG